MKLDRCVLAVVAGIALAAAATGCKLPGLGQGDDPDQGPPGAQTPTDPRSPNGDDNGMRRARRHRHRHGQGQGQGDGRQRGWDRDRPDRDRPDPDGQDRDRPGPGNRGGWGRRGGDGPPAGPDMPDDR
jgi:hypothetical protein